MDKETSVEEEKKSALPEGSWPVFVVLLPLLHLGYLTYSGQLSVLNAFILTFLLMVCTIFVVRKYVRALDGLHRQSNLRERDNKNTQASQALLARMVENLPDPFLLLDHKKKILMANHAARDMLGPDILRKDITLYIRNHDVGEALDRIISDGGSQTVEYKAGSPVVNNYLARLHSLDSSEEERERNYIFFTIYDITSIKRAEQMRVDFVANASHELRTPLASIQGFVETLQGPAKNDEEARARFLEIMNNEAARMTRLIDDLLSLSHIEREVHIAPSGTVDLPKLISSVVTALKIRLEKRKMTINLDHDKDLPTLTADPDQMTQVFQNLVDNAIKYGLEKSEVTINIAQDSLIDQKNTAKTLVITITNQGPGIPPAHIPRLTERFYRVDTARSRSLGGTGLGLAIVKHILHRHRGRLAIESEVGRYTRVIVTLPQNMN